MITTHQIRYESCTSMPAIPSEGVDLIVTSPPYPMIEMWDAVFSEQSPGVAKALASENGSRGFEQMHRILDSTWDELFRVLKPGGFACINIGDATRTIGGNFALYPNHMRIQTHMLKRGFTALPCILWRKQTNAPNKFMGSGMLPAGAYVTLEHEYVLIFRKGPKRQFADASAKQDRRESAFFWEERNTWFSDVWMDIKGTRQALTDREDRARSAAFPFELAHRLICMYSARQDLVLDPFLGTGTSMMAAMATGRNSVGYEIDHSMKEGIVAGLDRIVDVANLLTRQRIQDHIAFTQDRIAAGKPIKYASKHYGFPVVTRQETEIRFYDLLSVRHKGENGYEVSYEDPDLEELGLNPSLGAPDSDAVEPERPREKATKPSAPKKGRRNRQRTLFD